jgi:hypothetical protein
MRISVDDVDVLAVDVMMMMMAVVVLRFYFENFYFLGLVV